jgi:glycogen synthase
MRIALVSRQLATHAHSGLNRATRDLALGLAELGHGVHVIAEQADRQRLALPDEVVVHDIGGGLPLTWATAVHAKLARLHAANELDVASVPLWGAAGIFAVRDPRFPTVVSCMTSATTIAAVDPGFAASEGAREAIVLERECIRGARHLHGLTRETLDRTLADYGGSPLTASVVGRGLRDRAPASASRRDGPVRVLFVGRLEPRKGVDVLLDAFARVEGDVALTLAGPGGENGYRRGLAPELAAKVEFAGTVSDERLDELLAGADVVCQPSRYESHGIVLIEAMMFGKPIVTTSGGGIPEVVEDGGDALLAEPGDAAGLARHLGALASDAGLRARLGARARERYAERFEVSVVAAEMAALFERACEADERAPAPETTASMLARALDERAAAAEDESAWWRMRAEHFEGRHELAQAEIEAAEAELAAARVEAYDWRSQTEIANGRLWELSTSRTWRMTQPLREAARLVRRRS